MTDIDGLPACLLRTGRFMLCKLLMTSLLVAEITQTCGHTRENLNMSAHFRSFLQSSWCVPDVAKAKSF